jgi:hypothetical protein
MRAREFIIEGSGLKSAHPGEVYTDADGTEFKFQSWNWQYPADADVYPDMASLEAAVLDVTGGDKNKIAWINKPLTRSKSFGFAIFASDAGQELWIGKFYDRKSSNNTILDKDVKAVLGLSAGTADKKTSAAVKSEAGLQPLTLGLADNRARNFNGLVKVVSAHEQGPMLTEAMNNAASNTPIVFKGGAPLSSALQDDFCEILAPIAMMNGHSVIVGQLDQAVADVFKGGDISGASLQFPAGQNNPLIDSYIIKNGITLGVSSKGKTGAKASITNIWKAKEEAAQNQTGQTYIAKYTEAVAVLDICKDDSGLMQPITLGLRYNLLSQAEADALLETLREPRAPQYRLVGNPSNPNAVVKAPLPADLAKVPPALMRLFKLGGYKPGSYVSFLCLAQLAHLVADHINTDSKIDFGEAIRSFLNSSAMVQAKSIVGNTGEDAVVKRINIVYPPNFQEKAKIESNGYSGTMAKGKFSFSLPST